MLYFACSPSRSYFDDIQNQDEHDDLLQNVHNGPEATPSAPSGHSPEGSWGGATFQANNGMAV